MNKKKLLELLKDYPDDTPITIYADHGQELFEAVDVSVSYVGNINEYFLEEYDMEDNSIQWLEKNATKVVVLYGG